MPLPGLAKYQRATDSFKEEVCQQHRLGISQFDLSKKYQMSGSTIERWFHKYLERKEKEQKVPLCPPILGIDEHRFSNKIPFVTTICNLEKHKIFDILPGRSQQSLHKHLMQLQGRDRVKVVCIDLCEPIASWLKIISRMRLLSQIDFM